MCEMTSGNVRVFSATPRSEVGTRSWFNAQATSDPGVESCHGVPWELDRPEGVVAQQAAAMRNRCKSWRWRTNAWARVRPLSCVRIFRPVKRPSSCCLMRRHQFLLRARTSTGPSLRPGSSTERLLQGVASEPVCFFCTCPSSQFSCLASSHSLIDKTRPVAWWMVPHLISSPLDAPDH